MILLANLKFLICFSFLLILSVLGFIFFSDMKGETKSEIVCVPKDYALVSFKSTDIVVRAEIADTPEKRNRGLMFVKSMKDNEGMLFTFPQQVQSGFWMKNTKIPLDMIFMNLNELIISINREAQPCTDTGDKCPIYKPTAFYQYVLEVNGGFADKYGVEEGDFIDIEFKRDEC